MDARMSLERWPMIDVAPCGGIKGGIKCCSQMVSRGQGCQIFLPTTYQTGKKYTK
jgi:hypothetical protein